MNKPFTGSMQLNLQKKFDVTQNRSIYKFVQFDA